MLSLDNNSLVLLVPFWLFAGLQIAVCGMLTYRQPLTVWKQEGTSVLKATWLKRGLKNTISFYYWVVQWIWFARVNALCNLSRKKSREVTASLPGRFLSRRCFTLRITMEVEPRIAKQYKCHQCCSCKNYRGKVV